MTDYTAFVTQWATLTPGTTAAKLAQINGQTVTGSIPALTMTTGAQIFNCIVFAEFNAITAAQQTLLMQVCTLSGTLVGGSSSPFIAPMFGSLFAKMPLTVAALTALAKATITPWYLANGYTAPFNLNDCAAAGVT